jgi:hypothetical protein
MTNRRRFLKKVVYHAPVLYALGELTRPVPVHADVSGGPIGPPVGGTQFITGHKIQQAPKKRKTLQF